MVKANSIRKKYGKLEVLKGVDIHIDDSEIVSIVGASGAGKSTLLHILGTLDTPDSGELLFNNFDPFKLRKNALATFRNSEIGFIFQFHNLLPEFSALENICLPAFLRNTGKREAEAKGEELLALLGLHDRKTHKPAELSGGEQQRVAVARALINNPKVVFADEPSGNLDSANAETLHKMFFDLREKFGLAFVIVTHNGHLASISDRKLEIVDGQIVGR